MKRLLAFLFSLLPMLAWAANPSFDSFRQTNSGFIVNQPYIYVANTNTGGTNVIINGDVIYTNTTISYFVTTNFYDQSTIIITNSTVTITNSTVTINGTNVATINPTIGRIPFKFSDFQFGDSALFYIDTNTVGTTELDTSALVLTFNQIPVTLVAGENDVDVTDHSYVALSSSDPSAQLRLNNGNGTVTMMLLNQTGTTPFTLFNGDTLWDDGTSHIYLPGGDWTPTHNGDGLLLFRVPVGWMEAARFFANTNIVTEQLWQFVGGELKPTASTSLDGNFSLSKAGTYPFINITPDNPGDLAFINAPSAGFVKFNVGGGQWEMSSLTFDNNAAGSIIGSAAHPFTGVYTHNVIWGDGGASIGLVNGAADSMGTGNPNGTFPAMVGSVYRNTNGSPGSVLWLKEVGDGNTGWTPISASGSSLWSFTGGYLQPTDLTQPLFWTNSVAIGPGHLLGTNTAALGYQDVLRYQNTNGSYGALELASSDGTGGVVAAYHSGSSGGIQIVGKDYAQLGTTTENIQVQSGSVQPNNAANLSLGTQPTPFGNVFASNSVTVEGFYTGSGYSQLTISHTGTNGAVVFDSQAAGSAGDARQFFWDFNGTNALYLLRSGTDHFMRLSSPSNSGLVQAVASDAAGQTSLVLGGATGGAMEISPDSVPGNDSVAPYEFQTIVTSSGPIFNVKNGVTTNVFQLYASGPARLAQITKAQKTLVTPFDGMIVYQTDNTPGLRAYINGSWVILQTAADP